MGKVMLVLVMVLGIAASASAWVDWVPQDGVAHDWGVGTNWAGGNSPGNQLGGTSPGPFVYAEAAISHANMWAEIYAGENYQPHNVTLGRNSGSPANPSQLDIMGRLELADWTFNLGWESGGWGLLNVSGSLEARTSNGVLSIGLNRDALNWTEEKGGGLVNILDGGYIEMGKDQGGLWIGSDGDDELAIFGSGMLKILGTDMTGKMQGYIDDGLITGTGVYTEYVNGDTIVQLPEPATLSLLGLGGLALIRRKRS